MRRLDNIFRRSAHRKGCRHGTTAGRAAHHIEGESTLEHRLEQAGMSRAESTTTAGDEARCSASDEPSQTLHVSIIDERDMMVRTNIPAVEPLRGPLGAATLSMDEHEAVGLRREIAVRAMLVRTQCDGVGCI